MHGCMFEKKNKGADYPPFSSASIPTLLPSHTLDLVRDKHWVGEGGGALRQVPTGNALWGFFLYGKPFMPSFSPFPIFISSG